MMTNSPAVPTFATQEEASEWMYSTLEGEEYFDSERFAFDDDAAAVGEYEAIRDGSCCGFFDETIIVDGRPARIGCNFGH